MDRNTYLEAIEDAYRMHSICAVIGPRQVGKTTLARQYAEQHHVNMGSHYFDLESSNDLLALEHPEATLSLLEGIIIIDEAQLCPALYPALRVLVDNPDLRQRYLILGSASRDLIEAASETLAGRIRYLECFPFSYSEVEAYEKLWLRGGFPKAFLAPTDKDCFDWLESYIRSFLERDIPQLGLRLSPVEVRRFWNMLSHYHGQEINYSDFGKSLGVSHTTLKRYIDLLSSTLIIRQLQPWYENIAKRQVKTPKLYFRDSGIFHQLLHVHSLGALAHHPKLGASFEGFVIEELIKCLALREEECFFWKVHSGAELDLLVMYKGQRIGFEIKYTDKPVLTSSLRTAFDVLTLDKAYVIHNGTKTFPLAEGVIAMNLKTLLQQGI